MVHRATAHMAKQIALFISITAAVIVAFYLVVPAAWADPVAEKQAEANAALQSLNTMLTELDKANEEYAAAVGKHEQAKKKASETRVEIEAQSEKIAGLQGKLGTRARSMYRTGPSTFLDVLFGATNFVNFATTWDMLNSMNADDAILVGQMKVERNKLNKLHAEQAKQEQEAAEAEKQAEKLRDKANKQAKRMQKTYDSLSAEVTEMIAAQQIAEAQAAAAAAAYVEPAAGGQQVPMDAIVNFDEATGTATLSDGSTAQVVGYDQSTGNAIVDLAMTFVGGNYGWGAQDASSRTFDCSGLVQYVYAQNGISVGGHNDLAILNAGTVVNKNDMQPGDIIWYQGHVEIYAGDGKVISADNEQYGITYRDLNEKKDYKVVRY